MRRLKRMTISQLRAEVDSVDGETYTRFLLDWQSVSTPRKGQFALLDTLSQLEGYEFTASTLESAVLPARVKNFLPSDLDQLSLSGEVVWVGRKAIGSKDGKISIYLAEHLPLLKPSNTPLPGDLYDKIRGVLSSGGALLFSQLKMQVGVFVDDLVTALWDLIWNGEISNDSLAPVRSYLRGNREKKRSPRRRRSSFGRKPMRPGTEGALVASSHR